MREKFTEKPVGTGPYRFVERVINSRIVLESFDKYWGVKPKNKRIIFRPLPENATRVAALESGELQLINNLPTDVIDRISRNQNLQVLKASTTRVMFVGLTADRPPFNDVRVRQAMSFAIDRRSLADDLLRGYAELAGGPMHPLISGFNNELKPYVYDPERARKLLAEAGYPNGLKIKFGYPNGRYLMDKQVSEAIIGQLAKSGITSEPEMPEWATFYTRRREGKYDAWFYGMGANTMEPDYALQWFGALHFSKYNNATVDKLLADASATTDESEATRYYKEAQRVIWEEVPWVFLYFQPDLYGASRSLDGFVPRTDEYFLLSSAEVK